LSQHPPRGLLRDIKNTVEVDVQHRAPFLRRDVHERMTDADPRVVDEDIQSARAFVQFIKSARDRAGVGNIHKDVPCQIRHVLLQALTCRFVSVKYIDMRPFFDKPLGSCGTNCARAACD
jgi:hypothetical protein